MRLPPLVARVQVQTATRSFRVWVPLFLLWLLAVLLLAPLLLVALLATLVIAPRWRFAALLRGTYAVLCEARGTNVEVERARGHVSIALH
jgi:hypothetical protein